MNRTLILATRTLIFAIFLMLAAQFSFSQESQPQDATTPTNAAAQQLRFAAGTALRVQLVKTVDAKKAKPGDPVMAKTVDEIRAGQEVVAPRGAKVSGHVIAATPHHGDTASTLEIAFDTITLGSGTQVPMKAVIQAASQPAQAAPADYGSNAASTGGSPMGAPMGSPAGGRMGGGSPPTASTPNNGGIGNAGDVPNARPSSGNAPLTANSQGVIGMSDVSLSEGSQADSVLTSQKHNVKLEEGTQMILRVSE